MPSPLQQQAIHRGLYPVEPLLRFHQIRRTILIKKELVRSCREDSDDTNEDQADCYQPTCHGNRPAS
jgi:hypothetical protein